jgi:hypothetical protein
MLIIRLHPTRQLRAATPSSGTQTAVPAESFVDWIGGLKIQANDRSFYDLSGVEHLLGTAETPLDPTTGNPTQRSEAFPWHY